MTKTIDYQLKIKTADKFGAGTDNDVFITVYGETDGVEVSSGEINLSQRVNGDAFERNNEHTLNFQWGDIGRPTKIKLRLSNNLLDDWSFAWCRIKRNGPETSTEDPDINLEVTFSGNNTVFKRKDSHMFDSNLGVLRERIISTVTTPEYGGVEFLTLPKGAESTISMTFSEETSKVIEQSIVTEKGSTNTVNIGAEISFAAGDGGGVEGKASASYGFSSSTLETISKNTVDSISKIYSNAMSITITNDSNIVVEYTEKEGKVEKTSESNSEVRTYGIVYESSILEIHRARDGAETYNSRKDRINLGRRVRAVLPLSINEKGKFNYIDTKGKIYEKDKLWDAVK